MAQQLNTWGRPPRQLRDLEGHRVDLVTADGSRLHDVVLVSAGRLAVSSVWLEMDGIDIFVNHSQIAAAWDHNHEWAA